MQQHLSTFRLALLVAPLLAAPAPAGTVPLTVDWGGVTPARPFPVTGGLPFGRVATALESIAPTYLRG